MNPIDYKPEICLHCEQKVTYLIQIDKGTCEIVKAIARHIGEKGLNAVHPRKELEGRGLTSNQVGNLTRPRIHGLIAHLEGHPGNYCLTRKGAAFLRGQAIPKYAILKKSTSSEPSHNLGYFGTETTTIKEFDRAGQMWEGIGYTISEGNVLTKVLKVEGQPLLFAS